MINISIVFICAFLVELWPDHLPSGNQKTILARSCEAVRSEIDQPKTVCNLAGIYVASQGGFQFRYELLLQRIND